jgi:hypothetical protein
MHRTTFIASTLVLTCASAVIAAEPTPSVLKAESATEWSAKFAGKKGWIGGDGVYSVELGKRRILWLFGDTLLGTVKDGGRAGARMINNTLGLQTGGDKDATVQFLTGKGKDGEPASFFIPSDGTGFFWPHAALRIGTRPPHLPDAGRKDEGPGCLRFQAGRPVAGRGRESG